MQYIIQNFRLTKNTTHCIHNEGKKTNQQKNTVTLIKMMEIAIQICILYAIHQYRFCGESKQ